MDIIIYQELTKNGKLINKAGIFHNGKFIRELNYEDFRVLQDKQINFLNCKNNEFLFSIV